MTLDFTRPWALWVLAALAVIILLHLRRRRRRDLSIGHLPFWQDALRSARRWRVWAALCSILSLVLSLAAVGLLALSAAGPRWVREAPGLVDMVWVFDSSGSMSAVDGVDEPRIERARIAARRWLFDLAGKARITIVDAADAPRLVAGELVDEVAVLGALAKVRPVDMAGSLTQALELARERGGDDASIVVWSDGNATPEATLRRAAGGEVQFAEIGPTLDRNVGIVEAAFLGDEQTGRSVTMTVASFSSKSETVPFEATLDGASLHREDLSLEPGERRNVAMKLARAQGGRLEARLALEDGLATDNVLRADVPRGRAVEVLVSQELDSPFLRAALESVPGYGSDVTYRVTSAAEARARAGGSVGMVSGAPPKGAGGGVIAFEPPGDGGAVQRPVVTDTNARHPVTQGLSFADLRVERARVLKLGEDEEPLIETAAGPIAVAGGQGHLRTVRLGFALKDSNFYLLAGFPVFVARSVTLLSAGAGAPLGEIHTTGMCVKLPAPPDDDAPSDEPGETPSDEPETAGEDRETDEEAHRTAALLDGEDADVRTAVEGDDVVFGPLRRAGQWRLESGAASRDVPVNMLQAGESNIAATVSGRPVTLPEPPMVKHVKDLDGWCAGLGLACLGGAFLLALAPRSRRARPGKQEA